MNVAEYLVKKLKNNGVNHAFGIPGGVIIDFLYALDKEDGIYPHLSYHEQCSAFEANGYSQAEHGLACAYATRGPGFTNLVTGIADAYADSLPVVFITAHAGNASQNKQRFEQEQEMNTVDIVKNITKYAVVVENEYEAEKIINKAFQEALSGRKGPVLLDFCSSIWKKEIDISGHINECELKKDTVNYDSVYEMLKEAHKPVVLIGDGIRQAGVEIQLSKIINKTNIPVLSSRGSQDSGRLFDNYYGYIGSHGLRYSNYIFSEADLVIALGNRMAFPLNSESYKKALENKKIVRIECDSREIQRSILNTYTIKNDLKRFVEEFDFKINCSSNWTNLCCLVKKKLMYCDCNSTVDFLCQIFKEYKDSDLVMDVGNNEFWASKAYELSGVKARTYYSKSFGALGCSLAKSIGVFYKNKKHIVCVIGDQGFQLNMQELQFISREKIPILMLIINNRISGMIKDREKREGYAVHTTYDSGYSSPDFKLIAAAYDIGYVKADSFNNLKDIPDNNPFIIDFCADSQLTLEPSLPRGRKMYDMVPELDKYILDDIRH